MKIMITIFLAGLLLLAAGCADEKCERFASQSREISWTDYNSVKEVCDYFECYSGTYERHIGDTFKVKGFALQYAGHIRPFEYDPSGRYFGFFFGDNWKKPYNEQHCLIIDGDTSVMSCFRDYSFGQEAYLTVVLMDGREPGCCQYPNAWVVDVKFVDVKFKEDIQ